MFLVVVNTPDEGKRQLGPFDSYQEAQWRADYEYRCAEYIWGNEARADIGARVEYMPVAPKRRGAGRRKMGRQQLLAVEVA